MKVELEHWDGHKHVDIFIPEAKLYIEIDGLQHYVDPIQFKADLTRDHYSDEDKFFTKHISNQLIETHCVEIADTITYLIKNK
jgi:very-short-patch-repair endonuclease